MAEKYDEKEIRADYRRLTKLLIEKKLTITTMESATSGQIASLITDTEGSSAVLKGAFVTYCNEAKIMQGVPAEIIDKYTVYSTQTAEAMAKACTAVYQADIGIGVTGTMGNVDPANPETINWNPQIYNYAERTGNLKAEAVGVVSGEKHFPVFEGGMVFKPLTKSKPLSTPLFAYGPG